MSHKSSVQSSVKSWLTRKSSNLKNLTAAGGRGGDNADGGPSSQASPPPLPTRPRSNSSATQGHRSSQILEVTGSGDGTPGASVDVDDVPLENAQELQDEMLNEVLSQKPTFMDVVEVASEMLLDRRLEFIHDSVIVRSFDGFNNPGGVCDILMRSPHLVLMEYKDTHFLHVADADVSRFVCTPRTHDIGELRVLMEKTLKVQRVTLPMMMCNIRCEVETMEKIWALVASRRKNLMRGGGGGSSSITPTRLKRHQRGNRGSSRGSATESVSEFGETLRSTTAMTDEEDIETTTDGEGSMLQAGGSRFRQGEALHDKKVGLVSSMMTSAQKVANLTKTTTNLNFYVNEFVLLFEQRQPLAVLLTALDRLHEHATHYVIENRFSLAQPLASCLVSLTDVLTRCNTMSLINSISASGLVIIEKLLSNHCANVCDTAGGESLLANIFQVLQQQKHTFSQCLTLFCSALVSIIPSAKLVSKMRAVDKEKGNAESLAVLAECSASCLRDTIPEAGELGVSAEDVSALLETDSLRRKAAAAMQKGGASSLAAQFNEYNDDEEAVPTTASGGIASQSKSERMSTKDHQNSPIGGRGMSATSSIVAVKKTSAQGSDGGGTHQHEHQGSKLFSPDVITVLWLGGASVLESLISTLDNLVIIVDSNESTFKKLGRRLLHSACMLAKYLVRCLWFLQLPQIIQFLNPGAAILGSFCRRVSMWCALLEVDSLWMEIVQCASAFILAHSLVIHEAKYFSFLNHQWLVKMCVACGAASERSVLSEFHFFHCISNHLIKQYQLECGSPLATHPWLNVTKVWKEVQNVVAVIRKSVPSPSLILTIWEAIQQAVDAFVALNSEPDNPAPRHFLSALVFSSVVDLADQDYVSSHHVPDADSYLKQTSWDEYDEFCDPIEVQTKSLLTTMKGVTSFEVLSVKAALVYALPALKRHKEAGRIRSFALQCLTFADSFSSVGAPHSITALLVRTGLEALAIVKDEQQLHQNLSIQYCSILYKWINLPQAMAVLRLLNVHAKPELKNHEHHSSVGGDNWGNTSATGGSIPTTLGSDAETVNQKPSALDRLIRMYGNKTE